MESTRRAPGSTAEAFWLFFVVGVVAAVLATLWIALHGAARVDDTTRPAMNPFVVPVDLIDGTISWSTTATVIAAGMWGLVLVLAGLCLRMWLRGRRRRARSDSSAGKMGRGRDVAPMTRTAAQTATRLGVSSPGLPIGRSIAGGKALIQDWEAVSIDVHGPRAGKTTGRAIPAVLAAPGAVLATSNKRDLVDATRDPRGQVGRVWIFDPQSVAGEAPSWWWNPLSYVTDETRAAALAKVFAGASRTRDSKADAFFDSAGLDLLSNLLLAAAVDHRPLTQVYLWITDPNDDTPAVLLDAAGYEIAAATVRGFVGSPDKQRAGVYATAQQSVSFLTNRAAVQWVTPPSVGGLPEFNPAAFAASTDTLYSLSREGRGNAGPLVTALTVAVCEAAEDAAKLQPGGRLATPMVCVLDEAANVCRWGDLPDLVSHYGSRGIILCTFLQSWSQGVEVWGRDGMRKLWSACNVKILGGGVSEVEFLEEVSRLIGEHKFSQASISRSAKSGSSTSTSWQRERILEVSDLAALEKGRMIVIASGAVPALAKVEPWYENPAHRDVVAASIAAHQPGVPA